MTPAQVRILVTVENIVYIGGVDTKASKYQEDWSGRDL